MHLFTVPYFTCSASVGQCLITVVVVVVVVVGKKFKIEAEKPDMAMDHYITIAGNVKRRSFYSITFDLGGHLRSP